jgi:MazG family protein
LSKFPHYNSKKAAKNFADFCETISALRHPKTGCPWDLKQTIKTLRRYMLEEAYEAVEAAGAKNSAKFCEELGDVLLQVVLNAQIAADNGQFNIEDVVQSINSKMRRRHPHVFDKKFKNKNISEEQVWQNWRVLKQQESGQKKKSGVLDKVAKAALPANIKAQKIGEVTSRINFDWQDWTQVYDKLISEVDELKDAYNKVKKQPKNKKEFINELGDVYFTLAQLCRHLNISAEVVADAGNRKFIGRFKKVEALAQKRGLEIEKASNQELEALWNLAKRR